MKKIIVVSDTASDTYSNQEFRTAVEGYAKVPTDVRMSFVSSTPSTIHSGFIVNQMVLTEERLGRPTETIIFQHTDPRGDTQGVETSVGSQFVIAHLASDIYVCGPNNGYDFSFIKPQIEELFVYPGIENGEQLRSRDLFSRVVTHLADYMEEELQLEETHISTIPDLEKDIYYVGHIDSFGNMKTTMTLDDLKGKHEMSDSVQITVGSVTKPGRLVTNMFGGEPGELVIYPGSSGRPENPYIEISVWRDFHKDEPHTALHEFQISRKAGSCFAGQNPKPGDMVKIV